MYGSESFIDGILILRFGLEQYYLYMLQWILFSSIYLNVNGKCSEKLN